MSEQPKTMEQRMKENLNGDLLTNALDFLAYMDETDGYSHLGENICFIDCDPEHLYIFFHLSSVVCKNDVDFSPISEELKTFAWSHVNQCNHYRTNGTACGCGQQPGHSVTILDRKFDNMCNCFICIHNPDAQTFAKTKALIEACKVCIAKTKVGTMCEYNY